MNCLLLKLINTHHRVIHYLRIFIQKSKNKLNYYRGKDCMKNFRKDLREHATKIINYEKKKMIPLTTEEKIHYNEQEICYICKKEFDKSDKNTIK